MISIILNIIIIGLVTYATVVSLKAYLNAQFNKIDSLYWGSSFLTFLVYLICSMMLIYYMPNMIEDKPLLQAHINGLQLLELYAILLILGVTIRLKQSFKENSNKSIRIVRVLYEGVKIAILFCFMVLISYSCGEYLEYEVIGKERLMLLASYELTIKVQAIKVILLLTSFILMPILYFYTLIKIALLLLALSEIIQIINIYNYIYTNIELIQIENIIALLGIISATLGVIGIQKSIKDYEKENEKKYGKKVFVEKRKNSSIQIIKRLYGEKDA